MLATVVNEITVRPAEFYITAAFASLCVLLWMKKRLVTRLPDSKIIVASHPAALNGIATVSPPNYRCLLPSETHREAGAMRFVKSNGYQPKIIMHLLCNIPTMATLSRIASSVHNGKRWRMIRDIE